jgi:murein tripeptide amidase MpaA
MKNFIILLIIIVAGFGVYYLSKNASPKTDVETEITRPLDDVTVEETQNKEETPENKESIVIGKSAQENEIIAYHYGNGNTELLFVGGIHGGYSWNTTLVAYELADYLKANPVVVPSNLKVTIIPVLNPDGLKKVAGTTGRFTKSDIFRFASD